MVLGRWDTHRATNNIRYCFAICRRKLLLYCVHIDYGLWTVPASAVALTVVLAVAVDL